MAQEKNGSDIIKLHIRPGRQDLISYSYEQTGYRVEKTEEPGEHQTEAELILRREKGGAPESEYAGKVRRLLEELASIDEKVDYFYLHLVCGVGLAGAVCLGLSFPALHSGIHWLFTLLLIAGVFGCTITLYLRPLFTRMGMEKYGAREPEILAQLKALMGAEQEEENE